MAQRKRKNKKPMLYITQPDFQSSEPKMQSSYRSERKKQELKPSDSGSTKEVQTETIKATSERKRRRRFDLAFDMDDSTQGQEENTLGVEVDEGKVDATFEPQETKKQFEDVEAEEVLDEEEKPQSEENNNSSLSNRKRRSRFKEMDLEEKVDYFVNLPSQVPRMKCEVMTEEKSYRGWIQDYQDGIVHMKILQRPFRVELPFESIKDIVLRGF
ncbi:hypothetical protein GLW08_05495 [Pontibacillus yanchengensis]|uniref:Uncharacterized protein n=2 Tax=Pontibacillus yanchengensis TaxID=462910 RepID=A0ACC7VF24_9BACI|nr:CotO family spore coat protein [Pontibacillus yanchengensis]MYL32209.1 hypothetical protein [Pontibacillus yanchengensis]MYL52789.1 hypothetical protein [Pontibacillus yanchengensis]